jgi:hypothetical protein
MGTSTFNQTNMNTQNATAYRGFIDGNWALAQAIVGAFAVHEAATPNMTVLCDAGAIGFSGQLPTNVGQQTVNIATANVSYARNDIVVIDANTGVASIIAGTPITTPVDPAITEGQIPVARVVVGAGVTAITNAVIADLRTPVLAAHGAPNVVSIVTTATLTNAHVGRSIYLGGAGVIVTLPSPTGVTGGRITFVGSDSNTQTLSGAFSFPDGSAPSTWGITASESLTVEAQSGAWRVISMSGKQVVKTAAGNQAISYSQAVSTFLGATAAAGGVLTGNYPNPGLNSVNGSVGTYGDATHVAQFAVGADGRLTAVNNVAISIPAGNAMNGAIRARLYTGSSSNGGPGTNSAPLVFDYYDAATFALYSATPSANYAVYIAVAGLYRVSTLDTSATSVSGIKINGAAQTGGNTRGNYWEELYHFGVGDLVGFTWGGSQATQVLFMERLS